MRKTKTPDPAEAEMEEQTISQNHLGFCISLLLNWETKKPFPNLKENFSMSLT